MTHERVERHAPERLRTFDRASTSVLASCCGERRQDIAMEIDLDHSASQLLHLARQRADELLTTRLAEIGITPRQFTVMYTIYCQPGINQTHLSNATGSDRSTIAELVGRLEKRGFLHRVRSRSDARSTILELTDKGKGDIENALPKAATVDEELLAHLSPERRVAFIETLIEITSPLAQRR